MRAQVTALPVGALAGRSAGDERNGSRFGVTDRHASSTRKKQPSLSRVNGRRGAHERCRSPRKSGRNRRGDRGTQSIEWGATDSGVVRAGAPDQARPHGRLPSVAVSGTPHHTVQPREIRCSRRGRSTHPTPGRPRFGPGPCLRGSGRPRSASHQRHDGQPRPICRKQSYPQNAKRGCSMG